jgi:hypothetical protein
MNVFPKPALSEENETKSENSFKKITSKEK